MANGIIWFHEIFAERKTREKNIAFSVFAEPNGKYQTKYIHYSIYAIPVNHAFYYIFHQRARGLSFAEFNEKQKQPDYNFTFLYNKEKYELTSYFFSIALKLYIVYSIISFGLREPHYLFVFAKHNQSTFSAFYRQPPWSAYRKRKLRQSRLQEFRRKIPFLHQLSFISRSVLLFLTSY